MHENQLFGGRYAIKKFDFVLYFEKVVSLLRQIQKVWRSSRQKENAFGVADGKHSCLVHSEVTMDGLFLQ